MKLTPLLALVACACGASPEPTLYALAPTRGAQQPTSWAHVVELRRPAVPGYLDRADIVRRVADYRLHLDGQDRWAEPLADMLARVLVQDLSDRMPGTSIFDEDGAIQLDADAIIDVDLQRLDASQDGTVTLVAQVVLEDGKEHRMIASRDFVLRDRPRGSDVASLVATESLLLGRLGDGVSAMLHQPASREAASR